MPNVVVVGGVIQCSHKGSVKFSSGSNLLEIAGAAALSFGMELGFSFAPGSPGLIAPCTFPNPSPPPPTLYCTGTEPATAGISTQLVIGGVGAVLDNASGPAINPGDPSATWSIADAGQTLFAVDQ